MSTYTEDHLVEQPTVQLMQHELGWDVVNCFGEWDGGKSDLGRDGKREVQHVLEKYPESGESVYSAVGWSAA